MITAELDFSLRLLLSPFNRQHALFVFDSSVVAKHVGHSISFTSTLPSFPETRLSTLSHNKEVPIWQMSPFITTGASVFSKWLAIPERKEDISDCQLSALR